MSHVDSERSDLSRQAHKIRDRLILSLILSVLPRFECHMRSSEVRAEGVADFACGLMPLKAKCEVPFIASTSRQSRQAQNKRDRFSVSFIFFG